ncbi:MAG: OmpA family protein [Bacteroidota bacterium]
MKKFSVVLFSMFLIVLGTNSNAQFKEFGLKGGFQLNGALAATEFDDDNGVSLSSYLLRGFLRFELTKDLNAELGVGYGNLSGDDFNYVTMRKGTGQYSTSIIPIDARLLVTPFNLESMNPYFYAGIGLINYNVRTKPGVVSPKAVEPDGWNMLIPFGLGTEIKLGDEVLLDLSAGINYTMTDDINFYKIEDFNDGYFNIGAGITFTGESMNSDKDKDGLTKREELEIGTDPNNPDTDGDGLDDGAEVKQYNTDPKNSDSDGDGLKDGEEVFTYKTNPAKADTDGDGLNDSEEILKFKTDPLKADSDGDGLKDGDEVLKYKTDPLKADTDGDGLNDGEEVLKHKTDPSKVDTDGGTVGDGVEVKRGSNPLDPSDDVPVTVVEKEQSFDMVWFALNSSKLSKTAKTTLDNVYDAFAKLEDAKLFLSGHACSLGSDDYNMTLSTKRVNAVKDYLLKKGMNANVISTESFGETKPAFPNDKEKNRSKNRRVEIKATYKEKK